MSNQNSDNLGSSQNPATLKRQQLAELLPEAFSEGRLDLEALKRALGEDAVVAEGERYRLDWAGKRDAYKVLQTPTSATLRPQRDKSLNFDSAQHVFIEGENLEVLKVLQKAYFGKVKLIYIDPPYNTGNDNFIYPDRFQENKEDYLKRINELDDDGTLMREGFFRKNSKDNGHYHSNWLNMMLPRLYIARNLLRKDGVIFVSCDDNEVHNLASLMNEIFGEENRIETFIWKKSYGGGAKEKYAVTQHEYILMYAKSKLEIESLWLPPDSEAIEKYYKLKDDKFEKRGPFRIKPLEATKSMDHRANLIYPVHGPDGNEIWPKRQWWWSRERTAAAIKNDELVFTQGKEGYSVSYKQYLFDEDGNQRGAKPFSVIDGIYTQSGTSDLAAHFNGKALLQFPKPVDLMKKLVLITGSDEKPEIYMDFFAGSGSFAEAILKSNNEDSSQRKFICIQLPETCDSDTEAYKEGFKTIADVCLARIVSAANLYTKKSDLLSSNDSNTGIQAFSLAPSNFKQWRGDEIETVEKLAEQIRLFEKSDKDGANIEAIFYELLLRFGQELSTQVERLLIAGQHVFAISQKKMIFILDSFTEPMIDPILEIKPNTVIVLDSVFADSDELKSNLELQCRDAGIQFTCV